MQAGLPDTMVCVEGTIDISSIWQLVIKVHYIPTVPNREV